MKKIVIVCGLIGGVISSSMFLITMSMGENHGDTHGSMVLGYVSMLLAFSLIFVGIKNYRDKHNAGAISFGKAFVIGLYIALIGSTIYVATWMIDFYVFIPDFMDKYVAQQLQAAAESGMSPAEIKIMSDEMQGYMQMYKTPWGVALLTYMEILPVGLLMSLIGAAVFRKKATPQMS